MTARMRWRSASGQLVTFEDRRPEAVAAAEREAEEMSGKGTVTLPAKVAPLFDFKALLDEVIGHEARHAAVAAFFDFKVLEARADGPSPDSLGWVAFDHEDEEWTPDRLAEFGMTLIAGGLGEKAWPPNWPPNANSEIADERALARVAAAIPLDETSYLRLIGLAKAIVAHPQMRAIEERIKSVLPFVTVTGPMVRDAFDGVFGAAMSVAPLGPIETGMTNAERKQLEASDLRRRADRAVLEAAVGDLELDELDNDTAVLAKSIHAGGMTAGDIYRQVWGDVAETTKSALAYSTKRAEQGELRRKAAQLAAEFG